MGGPKTHRNGPGMENQAYTRNRQFFGKKKKQAILGSTRYSTGLYYQLKLVVLNSLGKITTKIVRLLINWAINNKCG